MLFVLQKMIWFLLLPPASILLLITAGLLLLKRSRKAGMSGIIAGTLLLYALSLAPVADVILRPLERGRQPSPAETAGAAAVVVPGGGSIDLDWLPEDPAPNAETLARLVEGVELAKKLNVPLILCGGNGEPFSTRLRDADVMAAAAARMGMPLRQIVVENQSRNTLENSSAVRRIVKKDRIVLVTSAYYMRRAEAMFARRGFTVIPVRVYYLAQTRKCNLFLLMPSAKNFSRSSVGIAEWMGMTWWRIRGEM